VAFVVLARCAALDILHIGVAADIRHVEGGAEKGVEII